MREPNPSEVADCRGRWRAVAFATGVSEREAIEAAIAQAYRLGGLASPRVILVDSPTEALRTIDSLEKSHQSAWQQLWAEPWRQSLARSRKDVPEALLTRLTAEVRDDLQAAVQRGFRGLL